jgi:LysR family nitrogen assimilation transcriptional regulator
LPPSSVRSEIADGRLETSSISDPAPFRELTVASPGDHPGAAANALVTNLLRAEVAACRAEGLWDINLA